jgi:hypothetical protein
VRDMRGSMSFAAGDGGSSGDDFQVLGASCRLRCGPCGEGLTLMDGGGGDGDDDAFDQPGRRHFDVDTQRAPWEQTSRDVSVPLDGCVGVAKRMEAGCRLTRAQSGRCGRACAAAVEYERCIGVQRRAG